MSILETIKKHKQPTIENRLVPIMDKVVFFRALVDLGLDSELIDQLMEDHPEDRYLTIEHFTKMNRKYKHDER